MKRIIQAVFFCTFLFSAYGQTNKTEIDYFNVAAKHYYNGKYSLASKSINEGLKAYPNSKKLIELKKCLGQNPKAQEWIVYNKNKQALLNQGFKEGTGGSGYTSKTLTDPNGKKHVFVKKIVQAVQPPTNDVDTDGDGLLDSKDNCDTEQGTSSNGGCPKNVNVNLNKPSSSDNRVTWNKALADKTKYRVKLTLVDEQKQEAYYSADVSGKTEITVSDENIVGHNGYKTTIRLEITCNEQYTNIIGNIRLFGQKFWCKTQL
jgi:uncharacterized protein YdeI (BOF family)